MSKQTQKVNQETKTKKTFSVSTTITKGALIFKTIHEALNLTSDEREKLKVSDSEQGEKLLSYFQDHHLKTQSYDAFMKVRNEIWDLNGWKRQGLSGNTGIPYKDRTSANATMQQYVRYIISYVSDKDQLNESGKEIGGSGEKIKKSTTFTEVRKAYSQRGGAKARTDATKKLSAKISNYLLRLDENKVKTETDKLATIIDDYIKNQGVK